MNDNPLMQDPLEQLLNEADATAPIPAGVDPARLACRARQVSQARSRRRLAVVAALPIAGVTLWLGMGLLNNTPAPGSALAPPMKPGLSRVLRR